MTAAQLTNRLGPEEYRRVLTFFERAVQEEPDRWSYWYDIGYCLGKLGKWQEAVAAFERVIDKTEATGTVLGMLGLAYIQLERYEDAEAVLKRAHSCDPNNVNVLYKMAVAYFHRGEMERAMAPLYKIISRKPHHVKAQFSLGLIAHRLRDHVAVDRQLTTLKNLDQTLANRLTEIIHKKS